MNDQTALQKILASVLVPAVRTSTAEQALWAAKTLLSAGVDVLELPLTVSGALDVIRNLREEHPKALIGAGTALSRKAAGEAIAAGAQFIVSPSLDVDVIRLCKEHEVPSLPGALTPTEIVQAWNAGADIVKVFPASALGGPSYIKALRAPLPSIRLMPMGGVTTETAAAYLQAGAVALGVGSDVVPRRPAADAQRAIAEKARQYLEIIRANSVSDVVREEPYEAHLP